MSVGLISLVTGWLNPLFYDSSHRFGQGCDFYSIYLAGEHARQGASIYAWSHLHPGVPYAYPYRYLPFAAFTLGVLVSLVPAKISYWTWIVICEAILVRNIQVTRKNAADPARAWIPTAIWLVFTPYYLELFMGQFTFVVASLMLWAFDSWQHNENRRFSLADAGWILSILLKPIPLLLAPIAILQRRYVALATGTAMIVATSWLYFARFPSDFSVLMSMNAHPFPDAHSGNMGLMALFGALCAPDNVPLFMVLKYATYLIVVAGVAYVYFMCLRNQSEAKSVTVIRLFAACSAAYLLCYVDVWEHHYVILLPALALLAATNDDWRIWLPAYAICALPTTFASYDIHHVAANFNPDLVWPRPLVYLQHVLKPLSAVWLFAGAVVKTAIEARHISKSVR